MIRQDDFKLWREQHQPPADWTCEQIAMQFAQDMVSKALTRGAFICSKCQSLSQNPNNVL